MSENAYKIYEEALSEQYSRNEARRIRTRVDQARQSPHSAGIRWPFELLQNALDAGPRNGKSTVTVRLRCDQNGVGFEHDGAPFTLEELAALLSGGSSKDFESEITTGRFGTGFLVTHVLADRTRLRGLMQLDAGCESFDLTLDRGGDEDSILASIKHSHQAIRSAVPVSDTVNLPSATFEYVCRESDVWALGLRELKRALPYMYGTRRTLGHVEIRTSNDDIEIWEASHVDHTTIDGGYMECRTITVNKKQFAERQLRVYRFTTAPDASAGVLVLAEQNQWGQKVCLPEPDGPRVFREYPLRSSGFIPVNFILDGKFDPDQERSRLLMSANDKTLLDQALSAAVIAVQYAIGQEWKDAHWLARASLSSTAFDATNAEEKDWWFQRLGAFAQQLAVVPIVNCGSQFLPAVVEEGEYADFISPRLLQGPGEDETSVDRLWPLVKAACQLLPPCRELAADWTTITEGWRPLEVAIEPVCVASLAEWVRGDAKTLDELEVEGNAQEWLTGFIDVVGECWIERSGVDLSALNGMIPNQERCLPDCCINRGTLL